eukprot:SAG22_NODE_476_length_9995_cov_9.488480_1_plen_525_part_00
MLAGGVSLDDVKKQLALMGYADVPDNVVMEFLEEIKAEEPAPSSSTPPRLQPEPQQQQQPEQPPQPHRHFRGNFDGFTEPSPPRSRAAAAAPAAAAAAGSGRQQDPEFVTPPHTPVRGWSAGNSPAGRVDCHADDAETGPVAASLLPREGEAPWGQGGQTSDGDGFHSSREGAAGAAETTPTKAGRGMAPGMSPPIDVEPSPPALVPKTQQKRSSALLRQPARRVPKEEAEAAAAAAAVSSSRSQPNLAQSPADSAKKTPRRQQQQHGHGHHHHPAPQRPSTSRGRLQGQKAGEADEDGFEHPCTPDRRFGRMNERPWRTPPAGFSSAEKPSKSPASGGQLDTDKAAAGSTPGGNSSGSSSQKGPREGPPASPANTGVIFRSKIAQSKAATSLNNFPRSDPVKMYAQNNRVWSSDSFLTMGGNVGSARHGGHGASGPAPATYTAAAAAKKELQIRNAAGKGYTIYGQRGGPAASPRHGIVHAAAAGGSGGDGKKTTKKPYVPPTEKRRDGLRWSVRMSMAAPPH